MKFELDENNLRSTVNELRSGLGSLSPEDNFKGFIWEGAINAGAEVAIVNKNRDGKIPAGFFVLSSTPVPTIAKGATGWTDKNVYLRNSASTSTVTARVFFYR